MTTDIKLTEIARIDNEFDEYGELSQAFRDKQKKIEDGIKGRYLLMTINKDGSKRLHSAPHFEYGCCSCSSRFSHEDDVQDNIVTKVYYRIDISQ